MEKGVKGFACLGITLPNGVPFSGDGWEQDNRGKLRNPSEGGFYLCRSFGKIKVAAVGIIKSFASQPTGIQLSEKAVMEQQWYWMCLAGWMQGLNF